MNKFNGRGGTFQEIGSFDQLLGTGFAAQLLLGARPCPLPMPTRRA
jgi:hypothetical protein